jgi:hypothetical protein
MVIALLNELPTITAPVHLAGPATIDGSLMLAYTGCIVLEKHSFSTVERITARNCGAVGFYVSCGANFTLRDVVSHTNTCGVAVEDCALRFECDNRFVVQRRSVNVGSRWPVWFVI